MKKEHYLFDCLLICICIFVSGCAKSDPRVKQEVASLATELSITVAPETTKESTMATTPEETTEESFERVEKDGKIASYLTGEMEDVACANRRPVAVMISNDKQALPQYGIGRAGIIYEASVEGVMNRYLAIFENYDDIERIGSVRSARTYYIYIAREYDAILAHYGQSTFAKPYLKYVDDINGIDSSGGNAFYRTKDRKAPHNAYTSGVKINEYISKLGFSQAYSEDYDGHFIFAGKDEVRLDSEDGFDAKTVTPGYTFNQPYFQYNPQDSLYYRFQYDTEHMSDEGQIAVKNLIIQYVPTGYYATTPYLNINLNEDSYGYYITNGRSIKITSKKDGEFGVTHYYDSKGQEITVNRGKTWVCLLDSRYPEKTLICDEDGNQTNTQ